MRDSTTNQTTGSSRHASAIVNNVRKCDKSDANDVTVNDIIEWTVILRSRGRSTARRARQIGALDSEDLNRETSREFIRARAAVYERVNENRYGAKRRTAIVRHK